MNRETDFYDIFDYYQIPFWQTTYFKVSVILILILIITLVVYLVLKKRKKAFSPWEWAQHKIKQLSLEKCTSKNDYKNFYFDLTLILKQYLNKRYSWDTEDKTDDELIEYLRKKGSKQELQDTLKKMLEGAVWIKFANDDVIKTQAEADLKAALMIIEQTIPSETKIKRKTVTRSS